MRKLLFRWLCLILVFAACFMAARAFSGGMGLDLGMELGPSESCGAGYNLLKDSTGATIHDSTGGTICCIS